MIRDTEPDGNCQHYRIRMQKEMILDKLRETGCRITRQRVIILDIILSGNCSSCKEIYYLAVKVDPSIGTATVYRMINLLEDIGAISSKKRYEITCPAEKQESVVHVELDDSSSVNLSGEELDAVIREGMRSCGYSGNILSVSVKEKKES